LARRDGEAAEGDRAGDGTPGEGGSCTAEKHGENVLRERVCVVS
jgi:hypothetical protein